ncbi:hypothetical protein KIPB_013399 [Kipferlia bialata]|uniref:Uncharacterized protein n=1 Tax=Kipferlia bialata TaxID=797122 RepID=A0A9K3D8Y3_9EUKA|nr:hypothetical protein KIPB_013399 [Kipferlia bialata]|eukprot:g13399.t1
MLTQETDELDPVCDVHYTLPITDADALTFFLLKVAHGIVVLSSPSDVTEKQRDWVYKHYRAGEALLERISADEVGVLKDKVVLLGLVSRDIGRRYNDAVVRYGPCPNHDKEGKRQFWIEVYSTLQQEVWEAFDELMLEDP